VFSWRKQYREAVERAAPASSSISFTPVVIAPPDRSPPPSPTVDSRRALIELEFVERIQIRSLGLRSGFGGAVIKVMPRR